MTRHSNRALTVNLCSVVPVFVLTTGLSEHATAQDGNQPVAMTRSVARTQQRSLVDLMPADLPALVVAPRIADVLTDLDHLNRLLAPLHPEWGHDGLHGALLHHFLGRSPLLSSGRNPAERLRALLTKEGLVDAGIHPLGPLVVVPDLEAKVVMTAFELVDRPQFERWLVRVGGAERERLPLDGEVATVVAPGSASPVTCLARRSYALCQLGVPEAGDPVRPLKRLAAFRGPRLGDPSGGSGALRRALRAMPAGAHVYAAGDTKSLAPRLARLATQWEERASRFAEPERRRKALAQAQRLKHKIEAAHRLTDGIGVGLYARQRRMDLQWQANLTALGRELLKWWLPAGERNRDDVIARWTRTPALMRLVARTRPEFIHTIAASVGWSPPKGALTGNIGLLTMGLDTVSPLSFAPKARKRSRDGRHWGFVFPSAVTVGVHSAAHANRIQEGMTHRLSPASSAGTRPHRPRLSGRFRGQPFHVQVLDQLMVVGMGPGMASAAVRRLGALPPDRAQRRGDAPFVDLTLFPRSIDAAFSAASIGSKHRQQLRALEAWRLRWKPLLSRLREVRVVGHLEPKSSRLIVRGSIIE